MLHSLGLAHRFTLDDLHHAVERRRGVPIQLVAWPMPASGPSGLRVSTAHGEYVFYPAGATTVTQIVIIGHELGHIAFDDTATRGDLVQLIATLMPHVDPSVILGPAARSGYDVAVERRAEVFGTVVAERVGSWSGTAGAAGDPALLDELAASMEAVTVHG
jgi:hypothetical protein